jgi:hypothetical protein
MIICKPDAYGTNQYYLGNFGMTLLCRIVIPDINNRPIEYLPFIEIRRNNGLTVINGRCDVATKKRESPEHSTKITPTTKRQKSSQNSSREYPSLPSPDDKKDQNEEYKKESDESTINGKQKSATIKTTKKR